jgi:hypothetical protein
MRRWIGFSDCPGARLNSSRFPMVLHLRSPVARDCLYRGTIDAAQVRNVWDGVEQTRRLKSAKVMGFASSSIHLTYFACEKVRHIVIFHHLKTKMAWLLLVVPMVELNLKRLEEIEHLIASFREKKVRTINYDHQPVISISQRYEVIQELNPCTIAIRCMLKS